MDTVETTTKKLRVITIRVSPTEFALIKKAAQSRKLSIAEFIRRTVILRLEKGTNEEWDGQSWITTDERAI